MPSVPLKCKPLLLAAGRNTLSVTVRGREGYRGVAGGGSIYPSSAPHSLLQTVSKTANEFLFSLPVCVLILNFENFKTVPIIETRYEMNGPEIESRWERDFPCLPYRSDIYPFSCTMFTGLFLWVKRQEPCVEYPASSIAGLRMVGAILHAFLLCLRRHVMQLLDLQLYRF